MTDFLTLLRRTLVSAIDTASGLVAATGRASGNVVAWESRADAVRPCVAYRVEDVQRSGGVGDTRRCRILWRAIANEEEAAHDLLGAVDEALTWTALDAAAPQADAYREYATDDRTPTAFDEDVDAFSADLTVGLVVAFPNPTDVATVFVTDVASVLVSDVASVLVTDVADLTPLTLA